MRIYTELRAFDDLLGHDCGLDSCALRISNSGTHEQEVQNSIEEPRMGLPWGLRCDVKAKEFPSDRVHI